MIRHHAACPADVGAQVWHHCLASNRATLLFNAWCHPELPSSRLHDGISCNPARCPSRHITADVLQVEHNLRIKCCQARMACMIHTAGGAAQQAGSWCTTHKTGDMCVPQINSQTSQTTAFTTLPLPSPRSFCNPHTPTAERSCVMHAAPCAGCLSDLHCEGWALNINITHALLLLLFTVNVTINLHSSCTAAAAAEEEAAAAAGNFSAKLLQKAPTVHEPCRCTCLPVCHGQACCYGCAPHPAGGKSPPPFPYPWPALAHTVPAGLPIAPLAPLAATPHPHARL